MEKDKIWKDIIGYENIYKVSSSGDILIIRTNKIKKAKINRDGYLSITLTKNKKQKSFLIHRIVANAFIPNPENKCQINHKNAIRNDNNKENLEWCTAKENTNYKYKNKETKIFIYLSDAKTLIAEYNTKDIIIKRITLTN
jgi:hypothetical protein